MKLVSRRYGTNTTYIFLYNKFSSLFYVLQYREQCVLYLYKKNEQRIVMIMNDHWFFLLMYLYILYDAIIISIGSWSFHLT